MRYTFIHKGNTTTCVSRYAGVSVFGKSVKSAEDADNKEMGERIARLRCDRKIAKKRMRLHSNEINKCEKEMAILIRRMNRHTDVYVAASKELADIEDALRKEKVHL